MAEVIVLAAVIASLLAERAVAERRHTAERKTLTNALMARHPGEFLALQRDERPATRQTRVEHTTDSPVIGL